MKPIPPLLSALVIAITASIARANGETEFKRGLEAFRFGKWEAAAKSLQAAAPLLKTGPERTTAFRVLGLASIEMGDDAAAENAFHSALSHDPTLDLEPLEVSPRAFNAFRRVKERLEGTLRVEVRGGTGVARVVLDGAEVGATPYEAKTKIGRHRVQLRTRDGRVTGLATEVIVRVGGQSTLEMPEPPTPAKVFINGTLPPPRLQPLLPARRTRTWGFVASGVSAAALIVGSALFFGASAPPRDDRAAFESELDGYNARVRAGGGLLIGGGLVAAAAVTLFALHREIRPVGATLSPDLPHGARSFGVRLSKRF
ncbi:MAG: hypothetical protein HYY84_17335 [Deltaproteobacteria bacterium]|nr:hypothetical protein [Deltaproteobacteria bacterium]